MPIIETDSLIPGLPHPKSQQIYAGLDACITLEVFQELCKLDDPGRAGQNEPIVSTAYSFERALQAPALEMMIRGFKVNEEERQESIRYCNEVLKNLREMLDEFATAVWDKPLNPRSHPQLKEFFYTHMRLPEIWISQKGVKKLSMNREALEKLKNYFHAQPIINLILLIRDFAKQLSVLETEVDPDGRMRTSYNIAGTTTLRWSSSSSVEGTGTNLQNLNICPNYPKELELREGKLVYPVNGYFRDFNRRSIRKTFEADEGWELCGIDLEQAESRELGLLCGILFNDWSYLDACEGGDLHTLTAKLIWRDLPWTGDLKKDREIADQKFYRDFSYRDMSKRGGHGSNYFGTPWTMARHLKVPQRLMEDFQKAYFLAFPGIPLYHKWVASQLQTVQKLTTPWGVTRHFFGRPNDDSTLREAIAFSPQSSTAVRLNLALYRVWKELRHKVQILAQVHDALYFQYRRPDRDEVISKALSLIKIEFSARQALINVVGEKEAQRLEKGNKGLDRMFSVPGEAKTGRNWGNFHQVANPNGLKKWKPETLEQREKI